jgi:3-methyladenine DNA glycosylase AlkD
MQLEIKRQLLALADSKYQKFSQKLNPDAKNILGVRLPELRKIAKQIAKSDGEAYLHVALGDFFEEILLQGLVVGHVRTSIGNRLRLIKNFISKIDNWGICDAFCGSLKVNPEDRVLVWSFLQQFLRDDRPFFLRFAIVMLLKFVDEEYIDSIIFIVSQIRHDNRYVKLAVAWLIGECCVRFPAKTITFLKSRALDPWTQNAAVRKITESFRIPSAVKIQVKQWKY